jgi:hypothetical protein
LPTVFIGGTACITSTWLSAASVTCLAPVANQTFTSKRSVAVVVAGDSGTPLANSYTYDGPGTVTTSSLTLNANSVTVVQVTNASVYDKKVLTGTMTLGGRLHLQFAPGYTPSRSTCFDLFQAASYVGAFDSYTSNFDNAQSTVCSTSPSWSLKVTVPGAPAHLCNAGARATQAL